MKLPRRKPRADAPPPPPSPPPGRCAATTRAGRPCRLPPAWPGAPYCLLHMPEPPVRTA